MAPKIVFTRQTTAAPGVVAARQDATGFLLDDDDDTFKTQAACTTPYIVPTEDVGLPGLYSYEYTTEVAAFVDGLYQFLWYSGYSGGFTGAATVLGSFTLVDGAQQETTVNSTAIADAILARDLGSGTGDGTLNERTVRSALRFIRNKWSVSGATLTVTKEDDLTTAWTATVATDANGEPIVGTDPA